MEHSLTNSLIIHDSFKSLFIPVAQWQDLLGESQVRTADAEEQYELELPVVFLRTTLRRPNMAMEHGPFIHDFPNSTLHSVRGFSC